MASSMYLRQAAASAIDGKPWTRRVRARPIVEPSDADRYRRNLCYWCHVMDETTYSDPEIVAMLNRAFVPVKVDTMNDPISTRIIKRGRSSDGRRGMAPLYLLHYFDWARFFSRRYLPSRRARNRAVAGGKTNRDAAALNRIADVYSLDSEGAGAASGGERGKTQARPSVDRPAEKALDTFRLRFLAGLQRSYDREAGGSEMTPGRAFYNFQAIPAGNRARLLRTSGIHGDGTRYAAENRRGRRIRSTGGGFHRYSTDRTGRFRISKARYDNCDGAADLREAYQASGDPEFARVARSIAITSIANCLIRRRTHFIRIRMPTRSGETAATTPGLSMK